MRLRVHLRYAEEFHGTKLYLMKDGPCGELVIAKPVELEWETYNINSWPEPTIVFQGPDAFDFMKGLANELASQGFVPDEVKERTSELTAVRYHLEDMRKIVFHKEGIST